MPYRIEYRFNKFGKLPHCADIIDETGHCVEIFRSINAEAAKTKAKEWIAAREGSSASEMQAQATHNPTR